MSTATTVPKWNSTPRPADRSTALQKQFARPKGLLGKLIGWWMARANESFNRMAIRTLHVRSDDEILEIGFGPGKAIDWLATHTHAKYIAGVDTSEAMQRQATARNQRAIWAGRVTLALAAVEKLPFDDCQFSKAFSVRGLLIWNDPARGLAEIRRVLKPGGTLVICHQLERESPRWWDSPGLSDHDLEKSTQWLEQAGFHRVRIVHSLLNRRTICLVADRATSVTNSTTLATANTDCQSSTLSLC